MPSWTEPVGYRFTYGLQTFPGPTETYAAYALVGPNLISGA